MEKPLWRVRASNYVVDSPYMRLRKDEIELPNGTRVYDYYIRESLGYVVVFPVTSAGEVVLTRQYRYGSDSIGLELPSGSLDRDEEPLACARRELAEETGYTSERWEPLIDAFAEPVRSNSIMHAFLALDAQLTTDQRLDETEYIEVERVSIAEFVGLLRLSNLIPTSSLAVGYAACDRLGALRATVS
jgi:ADP-ribose pyrophosphatase